MLYLTSLESVMQSYFDIGSLNLQSNQGDVIRVGLILMTPAFTRKRAPEGRGTEKAISDTAEALVGTCGCSLRVTAACQQYQQLGTSPGSLSSSTRVCPRLALQLRTSGSKIPDSELLSHPVHQN